MISHIWASFKAKLVAVLYALTSPPAPSLIPPKYRVTTQAKLVISFFLKTSRTGNPAVPFGSPSSL